MASPSASIRTLKENVLWVRTFKPIEKQRAELGALTTLHASECVKEFASNLHVQPRAIEPHWREPQTLGAQCGKEAGRECTVYCC
jgi:hypothetical protein